MDGRAGHPPALVDGLERSPVGVAVLDGRGWLLRSNPSFTAAAGRPAAGLRLLPLLDLVHPQDRDAAADLLAQAADLRRPASGDLRLTRPDGSTAWVTLVLTPLTGPAGALPGDAPPYDGTADVLVQVLDITERKDAEARLLHRAMHDTLTGLPGRAVFLEQLQRALLRLARHPGQQVGVLFVDLDGLKGVNDTHGHGVGDELLLFIAARLRRALRPADVVARLGGDEFTVLLEDIVHPTEAVAVAERLLVELQPPFQLSIGPVASTASIGIAMSADPATPPDALISNADAAMYRAKGRGGACYDVFDETAFDALAQRRRMETELREALRTGAFSLAYQPIVDLDSGRLQAAEALLRWRHPMLGLLPAARFIDVAERSGLILPIGRWVLGEACRQMTVWDAVLGAGAPRRLFLNVGVRELDADFAGRVAAALRSAGLDADRLCIEVTETEILADPEAAREVIEQLSGLGCSIAVDDFGTGYSSLSRLTELHVDALKVDMSFVRTMATSRQSSAIVSAILLLAHNLRLDVVAEGIETGDQLAALAEMGCQYGQGYHVARPVDGEAFTSLAHALTTAAAVG